jgi:hypothetical protein
VTEFDTEEEAVIAEEESKETVAEEVEIIFKVRMIQLKIL